MLLFHFQRVDKKTFKYSSEIWTKNRNAILENVSDSKDDIESIFQRYLAQIETYILGVRFYIIFSYEATHFVWWISWSPIPLSVMYSISLYVVFVSWVHKTLGSWDPRSLLRILIWGSCVSLAIILKKKNWTIFEKTFHAIWLYFNETSIWSQVLENTLVLVLH